MRDLVFKKFAEVFQVHFRLERVDNRDERVERHIQMRVLHGGDYIRQLADARRLDQDAVRMVLVDHLMQRFAEVADERAANAAGVHFVHHDAGFLEESPSMPTQHDLLALQGVRQQALDERGLPRAEEAGNDINFCHSFRLTNVKFIG